MSSETKSSPATQTIAVYLTYGHFDGLFRGHGERRALRMIPRANVLDEIARIVKRGKVVSVRVGSWEWSR